MQQLALQLQHPSEHFATLHGDAVGSVLVWRKLAPDGKRWQEIKPSDDVAELMAEHYGQKDRFISVAQFYGWRRVSLLKQLRACYVDIDGTEDVGAVLEALSDHRMPAPSFLVMSGRGIHAYWLLEPTHFKALPVWQAIRDKLGDALADVGADKRAKDCARVLRVVGSVHSRNRKVVTGVEITGERWDLHGLADEVLGHRRSAPVRSLAVARASNSDVVRPNYARKSIKSREYLVFRDLLHIARVSGVPEGHRDLVLFHMARCLSWFAEPETLEAEIVGLARKWTPDFTESQALSYCASVLQRAQMAAEGKKIQWGGIEKDPRYHYRRQTLYNEFKPLLDAAGCHGDMRAIISDDMARERDRLRDEARRREAGQIPREEYLKAAEALRQQVFGFYEQGLKQREIAAKLDITQPRVSQLLKNINVPPRI